MSFIGVSHALLCLKTHVVRCFYTVEKPTNILTFIQMNGVVGANSTVTITLFRQSFALISSI